MGFQVGDNGRAPRVPLELQVQYRSDVHHTPVVGQGTDLSASGLFVHTHQPGQIGSMVYLKVVLGDGSKLAEGFGRVARVGTDKHGSPGMGVQFIHLDDQSICLLERVLSRELGEDVGPI